MRTVRLTMAQALVKWLVAQRTVIDGHEVPLFPGVFAIFGHGNVTCLQALEAAGRLPTGAGERRPWPGRDRHSAREAQADHDRDELDRPVRPTW